MATVTGFDLPTDTSTVEGIARGKGDLIDFGDDFITAQFRSRLVTFFGRFDFSSMKALNRSPDGRDGSEGAAKFTAFAVLAGFDAGSTTVEALVADGSILIA